MKIKFTIPGEPCGKGRPRFDGRTGRTYTPAKTRNYEEYGRNQYEWQCGGQQFPAGVPLKMTVTAYFKMPESASRPKKAEMRFGIVRPTKKPDADNVLKACADMLNGATYHDDSQIVEATVRKFFGDDPRVEIEIEEVRHE